MSKTHNLNVHMYKFDEILGLFNLSYDFNVDELKRARMVVLKMHPDKSGLDSDYFLFYKKAFDIIVNYYNEREKTGQVVPQTNPEYTSKMNGSNTSVDKHVNTVIGKMDKSDFSKKFNQLFEANMQKSENNKNDWFKNETPIYDIPKQTTASAINSTMNQIKQTTSSLSLYRGVEEMIISNGTSLYDDENDVYVTSDPFSKLKFDDLRKVHKDQTVFSVSENDLSKQKIYGSHDELRSARGSQMLTPIEKAKAEQMLRERDQKMKEQMIAKQHQSNLRTMEYEEKNKSIISSFLQLRN